MIAVANFAIGLFKKSGPNPMDAIAKMIESLNKKLNIISNKLDEIRLSIEDIPKETDYLERINNIKGIVAQLETIHKNYEDDLRRFGARKGQIKFIEENKDNIENQIMRLRENSSILTEYNDPLTINFICLCSKIDYNLSKLINTDYEYIKNQQESYFKYFKNSLYESSKNLESQQLDLRKRLNYIINYEHLEVRTNRYWKSKIEYHGSRRSGSDWEETVWFVNNSSHTYFKHEPTFKIKSISEDIIVIFNFLEERGLIDSANKYEFDKMLKTQINSPEIVNSKATKCDSTYNINKKKKGKRSYSKTCNNINKKLFTEELESTYDKLVLSSLAYNNAIEQLKEIISIINI